jgi:hypothetical protein
MWYELLKGFAVLVIFGTILTIGIYQMYLDGKDKDNE